MTISLPLRTASNHQSGYTDTTHARWQAYLADVSVEVGLAGIGARQESEFQPASVPVPVSEPDARAIQGYEDGWLVTFVALLCRFTGQREVVVGSPQNEGITARRIATPAGSFVEAVGSLSKPGIDPVSPDDFAGLLGRRRDVGRTFTVGYVRGQRPQPWPESTISLLIDDQQPQQLCLGYDSGVVSQAEATRIAEHLAALASSIVTSPNSRLATLEVLPPQERRRIVVDFNDTSIDYADQRGFAQRIADIAASTPDAVAMSYRSEQVTYAELDRRANQLARYLISRGVGIGDFVATLLDRSAEGAVATLAVLRTGAAVVPLDPADNDEWIAYMIRDSAPVIVVTDSGLADRLPAGRFTVRAAAHPIALVRLDVDAGDIDRQPGTDPGVVIEPSAISHVVYTSGSTGVPKGALGTHQTLINLMNWMPDAYDITPESRGTWLCAPGFAIGRMEWMPFLAAGAQVHIGDAITVSSITRTRDWLLDKQITHTLLVTSFAQRVCAVDWPSDPALRFMIVLGEPMRRWPQKQLPFQVSVSYGSTEAAVVTSSYDRSTGTAETSATVASDTLACTRPSVGRPVANARVYVLDDEQSPVPVGTVGEIYVAGDGICSGYLNLGAETSERFVSNPLPEEPGATLFRTGDLGRWRQNGSLEVVGRQDAQTWVRGMRVEVSEVEAVISGLREVREAAVLARGGRLVGYVVPTNRDTWSADDVLAQVRHELPAHQSPGQLIALDRLPRLANGKLNRLQLPAPERQITLITDEQSRFTPFPLSGSQQLRQVGGHGFWEWESEGLDAGKFSSAWQRLIERHDALRTVIQSDGTQVVLDAVPKLPVPVLDLRGLTSAEAKQQAGQVRADMLAQPSDTSAYPLWDVRLTLLPGNRVRAHIQLDPLIADAVSYYQVIVPELDAYYQNADAELTEPGLRYRDYAISVQAALESTKDSPRPEQPSELPPGPEFPSGGASASQGAVQICHKVTAQRWSALKDRAAARSVSPTGIVLTAFTEVLRAYSSSPSFTIVVPVSQRYPVHADVERVVGDFTTSVLVPMRESSGSFSTRAVSTDRRLSVDTERVEITGVGQQFDPSSFTVTMTSLLSHSIRQVHSALGTPVHASIQFPHSVLDLQVLQVDGALHLGWNSSAGALPDGLLVDIAAAMAGLLNLLIDDADSWSQESPLP